MQHSFTVDGLSLHSEKGSLQELPKHGLPSVSDLERVSFLSCNPNSPSCGLIGSVWHTRPSRGLVIAALRSELWWTAASSTLRGGRRWGDFAGTPLIRAHVQSVTQTRPAVAIYLTGPVTWASVALAW